MVEVVGELQFEDLAFAQQRIGAGQQRDGLLTQWRRNLRRPGEQEVPGQDRDRVCPVLVHRSFAPSAIGLIYDVVVIEASEVDELDGYTCLNRMVAGAAAQFGGHLCQQRAIALASGQQMLGDLRQERVFGGSGLDEPGFDLFEARPDPIYGHQFVDRGEFHSVRDGTGGSRVAGTVSTLGLKRGNKSADKAVTGAKSSSRLETGRGYSRGGA